jgi:DNA-directed RNA polymerase beta subunit
MIYYMNQSDISWKTIDKYFKDNENIVVKHHLDSYNAFFSHGIKEILKQKCINMNVTYF